MNTICSKASPFCLLLVARETNLREKEREFVVIVAFKKNIINSAFNKTGKVRIIQLPTWMTCAKTCKECNARSMSDLKSKVIPKAGKMLKFVKMRVLKLMGNLLSCHVGWEPNPALTTLLADSIFCLLNWAYLFIVQVIHKPVPDVRWWLAVPDVHETQASDVGAVTVVEDAHQLFPGQLQGEQLEQQAKGRGHDSW